MIAMKPLVLVVEDEAALGTLLRYNLERDGFRVAEARDGEEALIVAAERKPDLVLLDWMLPLLSGIEVCRRLRRLPAARNMPIIMLTARGEEGDKIRGLNSGADDYVTKPFGMDELMARLRAALRRATPAEEAPVVVTPDFTIDLEAKRVLRGDGRGRDEDAQEVRLTPTEWHLVEVLVRNQGKLVSQRQLLQEVWGPEYHDETAYLRVHMANVRRKLEPEPSRPRYFFTEPGMGYRFESTVTT